MGTLGELGSVSSKYPSVDYDWGVQYNGGNGLGAVHDVIVNGWNKGTRVTVFPMYPQGDNGASMIFGTTVFFEGTNDASSWKHYYYQQNAKGKVVKSFQNGGISGVKVFAKKRSTPWVKAGKLSSLDELIKKYPSSKYDYAVKYNLSPHGHIHKVTINSWNKGSRITVYPMYPQGDSGASFEFGTAVFVKGTSESSSQWTQYYYKQDDNSKYVKYHSNGNANGVQFFVSARACA